MVIDVDSIRQRGQPTRGIERVRQGEKTRASHRQIAGGSCAANIGRQIKRTREIQVVGTGERCDGNSDGSRLG